MPELPEVEGVVRALVPKVEGKTIEKVELSQTIYHSWAEGKQCIVKAIEPNLFEQAMQGMTFSKITRRSKYIYFHLKKIMLSIYLLII